MSGYGLRCSQRVASLHLHQTVIKRRRAAQVGQRLAGELVHVGTVQPHLAPPDAQAIDHARAGAGGDFGVALVAAPVVEHAHGAAVGNAACGGVVGVHFQQRAAFDGAQALNVDEGGVEEVARGRRDHGQRVAGVGALQLVVGNVVGQAVQALRGQAGAVELAFAGRRREVALGKRRIGNAQIFRDLAARMGLTDPCFTDSDETLCRQAFGNAVDYALLESQGFATLAGPDAPFAEGNFPTPSGRCEFFSARLAAQGMDGLPDHVPNHELQGTSARYPLAMISPPARNFLNSTFVNVKSLRTIEGRPLLEMHPDDAAARGIADGSTVRVFNDRGSYECHAEVSTRARPGVVNGLGIWWRKLGLNGTNVNELTSQALTDLGRAPTFYDCLVEVQACEAAAATEVTT